MENDITDRVRDYICLHRMIRKGDRVCVAVSGGADSMCLLFLLFDLRDILGFSLSAVHVEHGIRGQASLDDMAFVADQCASLEIPLETVSVDACGIAQKTSATLEEAERNERYRVFSGIDSDRVALAHHMNDQAETFIFNSARGSGIRGLKCMEPVREKYIRPLLCVTRQETEAFCGRKQIKYRQDATNDDTRLTRNHIRNDVIPLLLAVNDRAVQHIFETTSDILEIEEYLSYVAEKAYLDCVIPERGGIRPEIIIDIDALERQHHVIAARIVKTALEKAAGRTKDITRRHVESVIALTKGQSGRHIDLIYGIKAYKEFRRLIIRSAGKYELPRKVPEPEYTVVLKQDVSMKRIRSAGNYTKYIDYAKINDTSLLSIRHRKQGDFISIKGGNKKLKDLLIEERIPAGRRDDMYFVAVGKEIVWIPETGRIGERFKVTDKTEKILRMEMKNG